MNLHPYFVFNGQAREALSFYVNALGIEHGEINTYGDSPMPHEPHQKDWVVHGIIWKNPCFDNGLVVENKLIT